MSVSLVPAFTVIRFLGLCLLTLALTGCPDDSSTSPVTSEPSVPPTTKTARFAYVTNENSNNISAYTIDQTTGALTAVAGSPFAAGTRSRAVTVDLTGTFAYVANFGSNNVSANTIHPTTGALTAVVGSPFAAGTNPQGIALASY